MTPFLAARTTIIVTVLHKLLYGCQNLPCQNSQTVLKSGANQKPVNLEELNYGQGPYGGPGAAPEANTNTSVYSYSNTWKIRVFVMYSYSWSVQIRIYSYSYVFVDTKVSAKVFVFAQFWGLENPQTYLKPQYFQKNSKYYL